MGINPAPDRLVVRLTGTTPSVGAAGQGKIVAIGEEVADNPKLHFGIGDTVLFGRSNEVPVVSLDEGSVILLGAADVFGTVSADEAANMQLVDPDAQAERTRGSNKLDDYISQLRDLAK